MTQVSDYVLRRLSERGAERVYGCPGDAISGPPGAFDRADGDPEFIRARHGERAACTAGARAGFTGEVGRRTAVSGPVAVRLLNGRYEAKPAHQPVVAVVGRQKRRSPGTHDQQESAPIPPHTVPERGRKAAKGAERLPRCH